MKNYLERKEVTKLALITGYFVLLALLLYFVQIGQLAWDLLLVSAIAWFAIEARANRKMLYRAMAIGAFLMLFDLVIENTGWVYGLWHTISPFALGVVPLQVMGIAFFGGSAWMMYMPKRSDLWYLTANCFVFGLFGALGEWLLIKQGLFVYSLWWTSAYAFIAYFITWGILTVIRYRVFSK
jgi:hypothetical protein